MQKRRLLRLIDRASELLLPRQCGLCAAPAPGRTICAGCFADLPWITSACERCGTPLAGPPPPGLPCGACRRHVPPFASAFAPLHYAFPIDAVIKRFKFGRKLHLAPMLADLVLPWLDERRHRFDTLVPVPLHRSRNAIRGFNQAQEIARSLSLESGLPIRNFVRRVRRTGTQSGLDAAERRRNVGGAFRASGRPRCRRALIVDDVMTTGETCRELAETLLAAGVESVSVLTVARASLRWASTKPPARRSYEVGGTVNV